MLCLTYDGWSLELNRVNFTTTIIQLQMMIYGIPQMCDWAQCAKWESIGRVLLVASVAIFAIFAHPSKGAGFQEFTDIDVKFAVWYPTDVPATLQRLGPFETEIARNAQPKSGRFPVVMLSHGNGGRYRNHYLTAEALVRAGFIVIAPDHQADFLIGGGKTAAALDHRYLELSRALQVVRSDPTLGPSLSDGPVNGLGYSLGGATVLLAAGAVFDSEIAARHCAENQNQDSEFCDDPGFIFRLIQSFRFDPTLRPTSDPFQHKAFITGRLIMVAPIYQGIDVRTMPSIESLTIVAIDGDQIAKPRFHAKPLHEAFVEIGSVEYSTIEGHHYAFIAPFPEWLTSQEDIPVAEDPVGFDRREFIENANSLVLSAFTSE